MASRRCAAIMRMTDRAGGPQRLALLVADDDEDDWEFIGSALEQIGDNHASFVHDGQELLDYLRGEGIHAGRTERERPDLVILDLRMPKMSGAEVLSEIRSDPQLMRLPVVVLTTSTSEQSVNDSYERGANSVISKPSSFTGLVEVLRAVRTYWATVASLPTLTPTPAGRAAGELSATVHPVDTPRPRRRLSWLNPYDH